MTSPIRAAAPTHVQISQGARRRLTTSLGLLSAALACLAAACAGDADGEPATEQGEEAPEIAEAEQALIGGEQVSYEYLSEIGAWDMGYTGCATDDGRCFCTATLINDNVVLTAAHCANYQTGPGWGFFRMWAWGKVWDFPVVQVRSFGTGATRLNDVALLRLATPVPELVARPRAVSNVDYFGASLAVFGLGCNVGGAHQRGHGVKRRAWGTFTGYGPIFPSAEGCPGDSGGPVIVNGTGEIVAVSSWALYGNDQWDATVFGAPKLVWDDFQWWRAMMNLNRGG
jgi:secreted trypsin-like serine protease